MKLLVNLDYCDDAMDATAAALLAFSELLDCSSDNPIAGNLGAVSRLLTAVRDAAWEAKITKHSHSTQYPLSLSVGASRLPFTHPEPKNNKNKTITISDGWSYARQNGSQKTSTDVCTNLRS